MANDEAEMEPLVDVFLNTETVTLPLLATARSLFPSPSISPIATELGLFPVIKSTFGKKELFDIPLPPVNVTTNGFKLWAINPVEIFKTVIGW